MVNYKELGEEDLDNIRIKINNALVGLSAGQAKGILAKLLSRIQYNSIVQELPSKAPDISIINVETMRPPDYLELK